MNRRWLDVGIHTPAAVVAVAWSAAIAAAVVVLPSIPIAGMVALGLVLPALGLALAFRPAVIAIALAAALAGVARAELPATDPHIADRARAQAGHAAVIRGQIADDSRPTGGGAEAVWAGGVAYVSAGPSTCQMTWYALTARLTFPHTAARIE